MSCFAADALIFAALAVGLVLTTGCRDRANHGAALPTLVVSGDTAGRIVPCGCTSHQSGGLLRRATFVGQLPDNQLSPIVVEAGGAPGGRSLYDRLKFEAIARGETLMRVAAHNIGASEAAFGPDYLREAARRLGLPLVSANARDAQGKLLAEPVRIVESADCRIAIIGVLDPSYGTAQIEVGPPREAVLEALGSLDKPCDAIVVLAYLPEESLRAFAESLPEVDLVVGGPTGQPIAPTPLGPTLLASATNQGKFLAVFEPSKAEVGPKYTGRIVELDESYADDPTQLDNLKRFYGLLAQRDLRPDQTAFVETLPKQLPRGFAVAGDRRCAECHEEEVAALRDSKHRTAWESIVKKGAQVNPDCQRCHVTGYGLPGGFASLAKSADRMNVGCESCHGPSKAHCDDDAVHTPYYARAKDRCQDCHDRENSPDFSYDVYWPKIAHGLDASTEPSKTNKPVQKESLP